jgi:hypothetical protein
VQWEKPIVFATVVVWINLGLHPGNASYVVLAELAFEAEIILYWFFNLCSIRWFVG